MSGFSCSAALYRKKSARSRRHHITFMQINAWYSSNSNYRTLTTIHQRSDFRIIMGVKSNNYSWIIRNTSRTHACVLAASSAATSRTLMFFVQNWIICYNAGCQLVMRYESIINGKSSMDIYPYTFHLKIAQSSCNHAHIKYALTHSPYDLSSLYLDCERCLFG